MRLTRDIKDQIVRRVSADLPTAKDNGDALAKRVLELCIAKLPPVVKPLARDPRLRGYLASGSVYLNEHGYYGGVVMVGFKSGDDHAFEKALRADPEVVRLVTETQAGKEANRKALETLKRDLDLCGTDKVFRERFPDLVKYLPPTETVVTMLPATTATMDALKAAGWPKSKAA